jgi:hypothetical protein
MTLINKLLRILPKKQVDVLEMDRKLNSVKIEPVQTIKKDAINTEHNSKNPQEASQECDGMINGEYEILEREIMPEKIICPDCGGLTLEGLEFCDKCGGDLTNT